MIVSLRQDSLGVWSVWVAMEAGDPTTQTESFILGSASTAAHAAALAVTALHQALDDVVVLAHDQGATVARERGTPTCAPGCLTCARERGAR